MELDERPSTQAEGGEVERVRKIDLAVVVVLVTVALALAVWAGTAML